MPWHHLRSARSGLAAVVDHARRLPHRRPPLLLRRAVDRALQVRGRAEEGDAARAAGRVAADERHRHVLRIHRLRRRRRLPAGAERRPRAGADAHLERLPLRRHRLVALPGRPAHRAVAAAALGNCEGQPRLQQHDEHRGRRAHVSVPQPRALLVLEEVPLEEHRDVVAVRAGVGRRARRGGRHRPVVGRVRAERPLVLAPLVRHGRGAAHRRRDARVRRPHGGWVHVRPRHHGVRPPGAQQLPGGRRHARRRGPRRTCVLRLHGADRWEAAVVVVVVVTAR
mmetsp:Transcript_20405/g.72168  ORF Transcript_20405/g.72168 Transcript_20405/m.72168 type:complete len:282 (-) Transcript_20405:131-976(-)